MTPRTSSTLPHQSRAMCCLANSCLLRWASWPNGRWTYNRRDGLCWFTWVHNRASLKYKSPSTLRYVVRPSRHQWNSLGHVYATFSFGNWSRWSRSGQDWWLWRHWQADWAWTCHSVTEALSSERCCQGMVSYGFVDISRLRHAVVLDTHTASSHWSVTGPTPCPRSAVLSRGQF